MKDQAIDQYAEQALSRYGGYVVMNRALADFRDGLKPVQRRVAYATYQAGALPSKAHKKSAEIVGATLGKWHPHGDTAVYDAMVGMVQERYPLIEGHGNFGGPMFEAAAARYTEARLSLFGAAAFDNIDIAAMMDNYSATDKEPVTLPVKVPLLLLNGSEGIGLGLAAHIPPHNLQEVLDAALLLTRNPQASFEDLVACIQGPDYGHGILLSPRTDVEEMYRQGRGTLEYRCNYKVADVKDHRTLTVRGLCPGFNARKFFAAMTQLQQDNLILYCSDQSDKEGLKIVVGCKDDRVLEKRVLPLLHTRMSYRWWAVHRDGDDEAIDPTTVRSLNLKTALEGFVKYRSDVEERRLTLELQQHQHQHKRAAALLVACQQLGVVKDVISAVHKDRAAAAMALATALDIDVESADIVLGTALWTLARANMKTLGRQVLEAQEACRTVEQRLTQIPQEVAATLESMRTFQDARGTRVAKRETQMFNDKKDVWVGVRAAAGPMIRDVDVPLKARVYYDQLVRCTDRVFWVLRGDTKVTGRDVAYLDETNMDVVGVIADTADRIVALDRSGQLLVTSLSAPRLGDINEAICVAGARQGDRLLVTYDLGYVTLVDVPAPFGRRKMRPLLGGDRGQPISFRVVPADAEVYDQRGPLNISGPTKPNGSTYIVGPSNYVLTRKGRRVLADRNDLLALLKDQDVEQTQPLTA